MNLKFNLTVSNGYTSSSQIARVLTESWVNIECWNSKQTNSRDCYCTINSSGTRI